ncbi:MAG: hypothetical protein VYD85_06765 [Pseudomonadota bacterium]|nr:hypothetical protein [Pseudomonadota bacterium]
MPSANAGPSACPFGAGVTQADKKDGKKGANDGADTSLNHVCLTNFRSK